ncbi:ashwin isoform X2 [Chanos chanos]|uniref:Ashwin n=1 Tax=Chanos chanos TaxID=29144 RepID=A0A6J2WEN5_CHACN|nr:ashwin isoform X2 [Chanos chanos]
MAFTCRGREGKTKNTDDGVSKTDLLLHPELLSRDFIQLVLHERKITSDDSEDRDRLTELYLDHVMPLPQRELPNSRWGRRMEKTKARQSPSHSQGSHSTGGDSSRKRPLIVFDGSSTKTGGIKLKKSDTSTPPAVTDRLKPPPTLNLLNPIRKLSGSSTNCSSSSTPVKAQEGDLRTSAGNGRLNAPTSPSSGSSNANTLKRLAPSERETDCTKELKSPDVKKKINHVTWP